MHKLREFLGCDFVKIRPFFEIFSRISPLGSSPKMTIRKSAPASEFLGNFIEKRRHFSRKTLFLEKAGRPYQKKTRKFCRNFLHFWKIGGIFQILNFWSSHITGRFWKIHEKFQFVIFTKKSWWAEKGEFYFFQKKRVFSQKPFCDFLLRRAYAKMKK
jgi:hypothetical protein